jgi:imidazoleglycerol-phosphate dehydratase/histidinol-phosphatase
LNWSWSPTRTAWELRAFLRRPSGLAQQKIIKALENEGIRFSNVLIDRSFSHENKPTRKPGTGLLTAYMTGEYDLKNSYVIGDRLTDIELAKNLGSKGLLINDGSLSKAFTREEPYQ